MKDVYIGRQPIYGRNLDVYAYELLFRGSRDVSHADFSEGDRATSLVLLNAFTEIGLERVVGERLAFLNLTRGFVIGEYPLPVPHERVVLEILETVVPDDEVLAGLERLKAAGYRIALDDYVHPSTCERLLELADFVKVDCLGLQPAEIEALVEPLRPYDLRLLAEKIETQRQFDVCREIGFDYFQGFFLCRPNVLHERAVPPSRLNLLRILAELQDPGCTFDRVQELVSQDVALSYRILRHINTARYGLRRRLESVHEALVYMGLETVRNLASLFLLASVEEKPHDLLVTSMLRAKMCALLARADGRLDEHQAFTVGLFSAIDAILDTPMATVLERLPLRDDVRAALLERTGDLGICLRCALAYERGDWDEVHCFHLTRGEIKAAFLAAVAWVEAVDRELLDLAA